MPATQQQLPQGTTAAEQDRFLHDPRFTQTFELPADAARGRPEPLQITYADYGYRNEAHPEDENVLLFFAPLVGSRMLHVTKDALAKRHKIRIVSPDRPGIGGTGDVTAERRMMVWRDVIPALLKHLGIRHVSLGSQSGGSIYVLDMLLHHPEFLHPERPYLAVGGPWILPAHSGVLAMSITKALPESVIAQVDKFATFINNNVGPMLSTSFGFSQTLVSLASTKQQPGPADADEDVKFEEALGPRLQNFVFSHGIHGMSQEALLLMQRAEGVSGWGDWSDYDEVVPRLAEVLRAAGRRLGIDVFFAETDDMIGNAGSKGPKWFDSCWESEQGRGVIEYTSTDVSGANHDTIWNLRFGAMSKVFAKIGTQASQEERDAQLPHHEDNVDAIAASV
ncbi:hypothetical protein TOPH_00024 [Tolypocladium ophioglossoides CBS 100239]|uniref:AB hydrolase-1 domain-containing protein n=1 Tax=Tolypocladium ophioglossoides (strain CBS 100239) TaxID=1163406 RepID=A0A0L0NKN9_TOLOC|nr:hypothetical protein TOPH_00024 [Tolypocladium ophioglossoides CBS 100239]